MFGFDISEEFQLLFLSFVAQLELFDPEFHFSLSFIANLSSFLFAEAVDDAFQTGTTVYLLL